MTKLTVLLLSVFIYLPAWSDSGNETVQETCSRVANINYQEVLVDTSNNNRGEGLRYYLEKDQVAKELLNEYQENNRSTWKSAALSTLGSTMIIFGALRNSGGDGENLTNRNFLLFGGAAFIAISYLISKTHQHTNEYLLLKSVEEYNKRNTPKIYFSPTGTKEGAGFGLGVGQEF